jgi:hypothetical protein
VRDAVDIAAWLRELGLERYADAFEVDDKLPISCIARDNLLSHDG